MSDESAKKAFGIIVSMVNEYQLTNGEMVQLISALAAWIIMTSPDQQLTATELAKRINHACSEYDDVTHNEGSVQ